MAHPKYKNIGDVEDRVIEECSEVIQAICKIKRFGVFSYHPNRPQTNNFIELLEEIEDLENVLSEYKTELEELPHNA